jgi:hypothetical protein
MGLASLARARDREWWAFASGVRIAAHPRTVRCFPHDLAGQRGSVRAGRVNPGRESAR